MKAEIERFYTCNRSPNNVHNKVRLVELQGLCGLTSHSAYDATLTESNRVKIDGLSYPNFM